MEAYGPLHDNDEEPSATHNTGRMFTPYNKPTISLSSKIPGIITNGNIAARKNKPNVKRRQ